MPLDLRRFARYWRNVEHLAMQPTLRSALCDILNEVDSGGCF
jgi:deoxyribodipyrimidine photo-lyase